MCRWMGYRGQPLLVEELLYKTQHSLIEQSRHAQLGVETFNGDGFGLGWFDDEGDPGVYRGLLPAWGDPNLPPLPGQTRPRLFPPPGPPPPGPPGQGTNGPPF